MTKHFNRDDELVKALEYVRLREDGRTMNAIAEHFGCSHRGLYGYVERWEEMGVMQPARDMMLIAKRESVKDSYNLTLARWPEIIRRMLRIATEGKSEYVALETAKWLKAQIVDPAMALLEDESFAEQAYASQPSISRPDMLNLPAIVTPDDSADSEDSDKES